MAYINHRYLRHDASIDGNKNIYGYTLLTLCSGTNTERDATDCVCFMYNAHRVVIGLEHRKYVTCG